MNIIEKILAKSSVEPEVTPGEIVETNIDVAMTHDLTGPLAIKSFYQIGAKKVWDNTKIVIILDHLVPASSVISARLPIGVATTYKMPGVFDTENPHNDTD